MIDYQLDPVDVPVERYNMDTVPVVVVDVYDEERSVSVTDVHDAMEVNVKSAIVVEILVHMVMTDDEGVAY